MSDTHTTPLELAERLTRLEATTLALAPDLPHCSVELSQNAKGSTQVQVKVYALTSSLEAAAGQATALYDELRRQYHER